MASTRLADAVGYPGSSVAFAQLLSGMERDGLIAREVRGKRTYRIILAPGIEPGRIQAARTANGHGAATSHTAHAGIKALAAGNAVPAVIGLTAAPAQAFDYDELGRRLLVQVIRRLAAPEEGVVADLERELATARDHASALIAENRKLRNQLSQAQASLDQARRSLDATVLGAAEEPVFTRTGPIGAELTDAEVVLLERLVSAAPANGHDVAEQVQPGATAS